MNEVEFRNWLLKNGTNKKVQGDCVARLKRVERELGHCDLDGDSDYAILLELEDGSKFEIIIIPTRRFV